MIKIQNEQGKTLFLVKDDATEPELIEQPSFSCPTCHTDWEHGEAKCPSCEKKEGE